MKKTALRMDLWIDNVPAKWVSSFLVAGNTKKWEMIDTLLKESGDKQTVSFGPPTICSGAGETIRGGAAGANREGSGH